VAIIDHGHVIALGTPRELISSLGADHVVEFVLAHNGGGDGGQGGLNEETLRAMDGVRGVRRSGVESNGNAWELRSSELHRSVPALLAELTRHDLQLAELRTHSATLEDVFVHLTGRQLRDE